MVVLSMFSSVFSLSVGWAGSEDHASDENLQDLEVGSSLNGPQSLWLHAKTVLPAGQGLSAG